MPIFTTDGTRVYAAYITGPKHVLLGLQFTNLPVQRPTVVCRPPIGRSAHPGPLNEAKVVEAVVDGVKGVAPNVEISEIVYVADDTPDYGLYERAASELAKRHLSLGDSAISDH